MRTVSSILLLLLSLVLPSPGGTKPLWTEYQMELFTQEAAQPVMTIHWFDDHLPGPYVEYPQIWRAGMTFGIGKRLKVLELRGVNKDGFPVPGKTIELKAIDLKTKKIMGFSSDRPGTEVSYSPEWLARHQAIVKDAGSQPK